MCALSIDKYPGFSIAHDLVDKDEITLLAQEINRIQNVASTEWLAKNSARASDGQYVVIRSIDKPSDIVYDFARQENFINIVENFCETRVTPLYVEYFNKPPFSDCPTPAHQDHAFYNSHFPDEFGITIWLALDDCNEENGCMMVLPSDRRVLLPHRRAKAIGFGLELENDVRNKLTSICLSSGSALIHGSYVVHACNGNTTANSRRALAFSYRTSSYRQQFQK